jgi:uncharacterized protein DUF3828
MCRSGSAGYQKPPIHRITAMRRFALAFLVSVAGALPAFAFDTPQGLVKAVYEPYANADFDWSSYDESKLRSKALNDLFAKDAGETPEDEVGRLDFDPYVDGQDYQLTDLKIGTPAVSGDAASLEVTFHNFEQAEDLTYALVKEADGWKIDDVVSHSTDNPYSLKAILSAPMPSQDDSAD